MLYLTLATTVIILSVSGNSVVEEWMLDSPGPKVNRQAYTVAQYVLSRASQNDLVLAPFDISAIIAGTPKAPALSSVLTRHLIFAKEAFGDEVYRRKLFLNDFINDHKRYRQNPNLSKKHLIRRLQKENLTFIVIRKNQFLKLLISTQHYLNHHFKATKSGEMLVWEKKDRFKSNSKKRVS